MTSQDSRAEVDLGEAAYHAYQWERHHGYAAPWRELDEATKAAWRKAAQTVRYIVAGGEIP
jgi:hypothetical protein